MATICARFGGYPSDYFKRHDWSDLSYDYENAVVLNEIDQKIKDAEYKAIMGK